jgi:glyoxylase-like metal-dependent hydrolase (beta-lactamase superfamily II)
LGELEKIDDILYILRFPELFNATCPLVVTERYIILIDTYMGPLPMAPVLSFLEHNRNGREFYIVNSHSHFDHIWGNCAFTNTPIISHQRCRQIMMEKAVSEYHTLSREHPEWVRGDVEIIYPDITFRESLFFHDLSAEIELFHLPGHSSDSIAIFLMPERIMLAADSLEDPFPLLSESGREANIDLYLKNLRKLKKRKPDLIVAGHGNRRDPGLIDSNIAYLENLRDQVESHLRKGITPDAETLPVTECLAEPSAMTPFYHQAHIDNIEKTVCYLRDFMLQ